MKRVIAIVILLIMIFPGNVFSQPFGGTVDSDGNRSGTIIVDRDMFNQFNQSGGRRRIRDRLFTVGIHVASVLVGTVVGIGVSAIAGPAVGIASGYLVADQLNRRAFNTRMIHLPGQREYLYLDHVIWRFYIYLYNMGVYFHAMIPAIGRICLALGIGMGAVKLIFGMQDIRKYLITIFLSIVSFFIFVSAFSHITAYIEEIMGIWSHRSVIYSSNEVRKRYPELYAKTEKEAQDFQKWVNALGTYPVAQSSEGGLIMNIPAVDLGNDIFRLDIRNPDSGLLSIDRVFVLVQKTFLGIFDTVTDGNRGALALFNSLKNLPTMILGVFTAILYLFAMGHMFIKYFGVMVSFTFIRAVGAILIPMMLWEGTKMHFEKLVDSLFRIAIKLLIIQICFYIIVNQNVEFLWTMWTWGERGGAQFSGARLEYYLSLIVTSLMVLWISQASEGIADMLWGGRASMGMGEFKKGLSQAMAPALLAAATAAKVAKTGAGIVRGARQGLGAAGAAKGAGKKAHGAGKAAKQGGNKTTSLSPRASANMGRAGAMLSGGGKMLKGALKNGVGSQVDKFSGYKMSDIAKQGLTGDDAKNTDQGSSHKTDFEGIQGKSGKLENERDKQENK